MLRLRIICIISIFSSIAVSLRASDDMTSFPVSTPIAEYSFQKGMLLNFGWDNFALQADSGALLHDLELSFELLREEQVPRMPSYMVNVTGDKVGAYRLLPNGVHFEEAATITVPYDEYLLPMGYKAKDVKTYYFDEELAQWKELERIMVDTTRHVVVSYTTHFTDFANAVIKMPEVPEMKAFVPTAMQDLPDVDPLQGIPMIAAPTANNRGTAELTYPIALPPGRGGMQPNIDLHYSSAGGNDVLGVGWSFVQPAITIDTRWGVPRYSVREETEAYLLNGEQIVLHDANGDPILLPHQAGGVGFAPRKYGLVQYYARDTKNQDRIERYGHNLKEIWWKVTDRSGTTSYYGYDPILHRIEENAIVRKDSIICYWALTATIDMFGNYIHYNYMKDNNEVYLSSIDYTGNLRTGIGPYYTIIYHYNMGLPNEIISGRLGVLQKKIMTLECITISYDNTHPIAQYSMTYGYGDSTLNKLRLASVTKYDHPACHDCCEPEPKDQFNEWNIIDNYLHNHNYSNYQAISGALDDGIGEEIPGSVTTFQYQNAKPLNALFTSANRVEMPDYFGKSNNQSWSIGGTATVGLGNNPIFTSLSLGANYNYSRGTGSIASMMLDIDGDGLPDLVGQYGDKVYYYKQLPSGVFSDSVRIQGLTSLSREISNTHSFGVQADFAANFSYNPSISNSYTDIYFSDVNGDGLPDLVEPDGVKMNQLVNDVPTFTSIDNTEKVDVNNTRCGTVYRDGEVDERLECKNEWVKETAVLWNSLLVAEPGKHVDSLINVSHNTERPSFELSNHIAPTEGKETTFYGLMHVEPINSSTYSDIPSNPGIPYSNNNGDSVTYSLNLNPNWTTPDYHLAMVGDSLYVYHLETTCIEKDTLPNVDIVRVWVAPATGKIKLNSYILLNQDNSFSRQMARKADGVKYYIQHNNNTLIDSATISANYYDTVRIVRDTISVSEHDVLLFRLSANQNRRFDDTHWEQTITYTSGATGTYQSADDYVCSGRNIFKAPCNGTAVVGYSYTDTQNQPVTISVKKNGAPITVLSPSSISVNAGDSITFDANYTGTEPQWSKVHIRPFVKFLHSSSDSAYQHIHDTLYYYPDVRIHCSSIIQNETDSLRKRYGLLHRGWGLFAYNNKNRDDIINIYQLYNAEDYAIANAQTDSSSIKQQFASVDSASIRTYAQQGNIAPVAQGYINTANTYNPLENGSKWIAMHADSRTETWKAYGNLGTIGMKLHSTSMQFDNTPANQATDIEYDSAIPVPTSQGSAVKTVRKKNSSVQHGLSAGVAMVSANFSFGTYDVDMDYIDMNGDGFPDFVSSTSIQYSTPWGGIGSIEIPNASKLSHNETYSQGAGFSGSKNTWGRMPSNGEKTLNVYNNSLGGNIGASVTENMGKTTYMDVNADGLPDIVKSYPSKDSVWYNLGYSFSQGEEIYGLSSSNTISIGVSSATSASASAGIGSNLLSNIGEIAGVLASSQDIETFLHSATNFSLFQYSLSGGVSFSVADNSTTKRMVDINGDGYPDILSNNMVSVFANGQYSGSQSLNINPTQNSTTGNMGINAGVTIGFTPGVLPIKLCFGIQTMPWSGASSVTESELMDINGDGFIDYVQVSQDAQNHVDVFYNQNGLVPVNLLTSVTNPTGQEITLTYRQTTPSVEQRGRTWQLASVVDSSTIYDGTNAGHSVISYGKPYHDNFERSDFGYDTVRTIYNQDKCLIETYSNSYFISKGEKLSDLLEDNHANKYIKHSHQIGYKDLNNNDVVNPSCGDAAIRIAYDFYQTDYYEGYSNPQITTRYTITYDQFHNIISYFDEGDISITEDNWTQTITYAHPAQNRWHHNLISLPIEEVVTSGSSVLRQSSAIYNIFGLPEWIIKSTPNHSIDAGTYMGYDVYGNIAEISFPEDQTINGKRFWNKYDYDAETQSLPAMMLNPFMEQQYLFYDYRFGLPVMIIDPSGNAIQYEYDDNGRLVDVMAPREYLHGDEPYTVHYSYRIPNHELGDENDSSPAIPDPGCRSYHSDYPYVIKLGLSEGIADVSAIIYDQRGKQLQKKHLYTINNSVTWVADGVKKYDAFYRPIRISLPFISNAFVGDWDTSSPTDVMKFFYDVLDRKIYTINCDGTDKYYWYDFGTDNRGVVRFLTSITDENHNTSFVFQSPQEWTVQTTSVDGYNTEYYYNAIGERIEVIDADGYQTTYTYDIFGNCVERNHPDAGVTRWTYTPIGGIETVETNTLINNGQTITYSYDFGRLKNVNYPNSSYNDITYDYDFAGRIQTRQDGVGSELFYYDELSNPIYSYRHIVVPTDDDAYKFYTSSSYDSFGRIRRIIYPDKDTVWYRYNLTGELATVIHRSLGGLYETLLSDIEYNENGQKTHEMYGNGVYSDYTYDPQRQWLTNKETQSLSDVFQDLRYSYDPTGNIENISQYANDCYGMGGQYSKNYFYDNNYRLVSVSDGVSSAFDYTLNMSYSPAGRIGINNYYCSSTGDQKQLSYGYDDAVSTHQPRVVYDNIPYEAYELYWDANGNLSQIYNCYEALERLHLWDDENRLNAVIGPKQAGFYGYDGNGNRVWKLIGTISQSSQNAGEVDCSVFLDDGVLYPNPYMTITPTGYTKHYYVGSERIATILGEGGWGCAAEALNEHDVDVLDNYQSYYMAHIPISSSEATHNYDIEGQDEPTLQYECDDKISDELTMTIDGYPIFANTIASYENSLGHNDQTFYVHSDHLGSASWITDDAAHPVQYIHYAPYGELVANQQATGSTYDERYKFTGKERDAESGYDYFGARFLAHQLGIWTSPDPLVDKYIYATPYIYCNGNPIKYVDPDGNAIHIAAGAIIGAVIGGTISGIAAMNDPSNSRRQVLGAIAGGAISGAITGGVAAFTGGLTLGATGTIAAGAGAGLIGESAGSAVSQGIGNGEINVGEVVRAGLVGAVAGTVTGAASKGVSEAVKKSGVVQNIQTKMLDGVKSGTGKVAKQQANQTRKSIINFCSPGNDKQFQMKDLITYPADVVGQEVSAGATNSESVVDKTQEVQSNVVDKLGL